VLAGAELYPAKENYIFVNSDIITLHNKISKGLETNPRLEKNSLLPMGIKENENEKKCRYTNPQCYNSYNGSR
jgi:hypothetical protein